MSSTTPPPDETWTTGQAADYLNAGGVDFKIDARKVRMMADDPDCQVRAVRGGTGWRRVLASTVRAERERMLAAVGRRDPGGAGVSGRA